MTENASRLHWLKFNPSEWQGRCSHLNDAEYGLYHRVVEVLWRTPGNRMPKSDLSARLRLTRDSQRSEMLDQLVLGQELRIDQDDIIDCPHLHEAFTDACKRSLDAAKGGQARAAKARSLREEKEDIDF